MTTSDGVDEIVGAWRSVRPDLDVSPMEVVGRLSRLTRLAERELSRTFGQHGIESWEFDVLATLRRSPPPHELSAGELVRSTMVTTGAMTNRIDRLAARGLVERGGAADRRKTIVRLTDDGRELVDRVVVDHLATEERLLGSLTPPQRTRLANQLKSLLLSLGDQAEPAPPAA